MTPDFINGIRQLLNRVLSADKNKIRVEAEFSGGEVDSIPSGLKNGMRVRCVMVTNTATPIPATTLTKRNEIKIINTHDDEILYYNDKADFATVDAINTECGDEIPPKASTSILLAENITIYLKYPPGKSGLVKYREVG